jgi:hypothetical protein
MLGTIVTFGLILVFFDFTLLQLILMLVLIVTAMLFLLGLVTIDEVRAKLNSMKKTGLLKQLNEMKFFDRSRPVPGVKSAPKAEKAASKPDKKPTVPEKPGGIGFHLNSFMTSLGSLGTIIREKTRQGKKVEDINKMLDKAVSEKVSKTAPPAGSGSTSDLPLPGGAGSGPGGSATDTDPFLTLSNDDFDPGLLDGLDDETASFPSPDGDGGAGEPGLSLPEPELSMPSLEDSGGSDALPADAGTSADGGLDAFKGLDGNDAVDEDFGSLDDLNLDDVELDDDTGGGLPAAPAPAPVIPAPSAAAPQADSGAVKTAWIPSDAPKGADAAEDQLGVQSDMASFASASGSGSDEDLLSSLASDVKMVKKEKNISLLRELKDFKAPADEIENELKDMFGRMNVIQKPKEKTEPPANGIK